MASDFNVKQHDLREVEYNIYEDPIFKTTFVQLSVSDIKDGKGKIHTYDGEDAEFIYDILVGKVAAVKKSTYDEVVDGLIKMQKKYADLERDYQYYVKDKTEIFNKREKYINELEDTIHKERKKYAEATKLNDDLHKDLAQWKQMYEEVYACYNHEVDIKRENEELMMERDALKANLNTLGNVNRELGIERDKLDEIIENQANTIRELEEKNDLQESTIHKLETVISKKANEIQTKEHRLERQRQTVLVHCNRIDNLTEQNRELKNQNDELQKRNDGLCKRLDELAGKTYCSEDIYSARISYLESENDKLRKDLAEQKLISAALEKQIGELKLENECQKVTIKKHEKHIGAYATEVRDLRRELARVNGVIECQEIAHNYRYLKSENDKLRKDLDDAFVEVKKLSDERACLIKRQEECVLEVLAIRDCNKYMKSRCEKLENEQAESIKKIEELETKLKNAQEKTDLGLRIRNSRLKQELEILNEAHQDLMNDVTNSNRVIERLKNEIKRLENEPKYMQISGLRAGSMVLKLIGENHKLRKDLVEASMALSEKDCALAEVQTALMKGRHCCGCPFRG